MCAPQIQNALSIEQFEDTLLYFSESLLAKESESEVLWDITQKCISRLGFVDCVIYLLDVPQKKLIQTSAYGPKSSSKLTIHNPVEIEIGKGITGFVAKTGKAEIINDTSKDERYIVDDKCRLSEICVPIVYKKTIYGVIDCEHPQKNFFTSLHLKILTSIASICAVKIKSIRDHKELIDKQEKLIQIKKEVVNLKLKTIKSQLNPHFVFNAINSIQYFITEGDKKSSLTYLSTFSKLIRFYLKNIEKDTIITDEEILMLKLYLKLQKLRYNSFDVVFKIEDNIELKEAKIPPFIIQNLFENLIENSIFNQYKNQTISINFSIKNSVIHIQIIHKFNRIQKDKSKHFPEYRNQILKWQEQIELINNTRKQVIKFNLNTNIKSNKIVEDKIMLTIPTQK